MANPPVDPVVHLPYDDSYRISSRDFEILQNALTLRIDNDILRRKNEKLLACVEALERIASPDCQLACASLPNHAPCASCVARAALDEANKS